MRITTVRIIVQICIFALFMAFVFLTTFASMNEYPGLALWVSKFLEIDPLVAIATAITTHTLYKGLAWSLVLLIPTLFLGRFFCNWVCPLGIINHFVGWVFNARDAKQKIESNRYRKIYAIKYYVLIGMLMAGVFGSLQIGLLDPICLLHRSLTGSLLPTLNMPAQSIFGDYNMHHFGWVIGFIILFLVSMNLIIPRFFCRVLCPLGALLGLLSRFAFWRIERDPAKCTECGLCLQGCEGASDPQTLLRKSECVVCFNCIEDCPHDALSFSILPAKSHEVTHPDLRKRHAIFAALTGALFFGFTKSSAKSTRDFSAKVIRPPGSCEEQEFLERCIKCDQCIRVCPTNVLQPAMMEAGLEGLWTPILNFRLGFCQLQCTACGQVCPTGAIQRISVEEKLGLGRYAEQGPVRLGTAHFDLGRCLPWAKNTPCVVCEEVCPTSPKAIHSERMRFLVRDGKKVITAVAGNAITVADFPKPGQIVGEPCTFQPNEFKGDETTTYYAQIVRQGGVSEWHKIISNDADTLILGDSLRTPPEIHDVAAIHVEHKVPKVDIRLCTGCGICEHECPVTGDRRAVYITADGETRSQQYPQADRNRSLRLMKEKRG